MSPEVNGNPPSVVKRKKNRDKGQAPQPSARNFNLEMSNYSMSTNPFNVSIPDMSFMYLNSSEPVSLPVYPMNYPGYGFMGPTSVPYVGVPKHSTLPPDMHMNEYLSLPVVNLDQNEDSGKRRFSDPGLPNESDSSSNSMEDGVVRKLYDQIKSLQDANRRLSLEVMEMRNELNILKQQQSMRHRDYEPGMLADIIREVRDAARVREDALLARVKHIIEEKQLSLNHLQLVTEKNRNNDRISKLEEQLKNLSVEHSRSDESSNSLVAIESGSSANTARQILELEKEALELRRELQDTRAKKEEADQKILLLDKKLSKIMRRNDVSIMSDDDAKTGSIDSLSTVTTTSSMSQALPRVTLSGPVTDL